MGPRRTIRGARQPAPSARDRNTLVEVIDAVQGQGTPEPNVKAPPLRVLNTTDDALPPGSVLMIDGPLVPPSDQYAESEWVRVPGFRGIVPIERLQPSAIVITTATINPHKVGPCVIGNTFWARVRLDDEAHQYASPITGQTRRLKSDRVGPARILWRDRTPWPIPVDYTHLADVIDSVDNTEAPPTQVTGDRYILDDTGASHADWGGAAANSIVVFDGASWVETVPNADEVVHATSPERDYRFNGEEWIDGPPGRWPSWAGPWCLLHLSDLQQQLSPSQARFGYVDGSITSAAIADRDADSDPLTYDSEDPDTQVDDDLTPGRGTVHLWDFQISRRASQRFAIVGFYEPTPGEPDYTRPIVTDADGQLESLTTDSRIYVEKSTRSTGFYYCTAAASHDAGQTTLTLNEELTPLPDPNPDPEVLGSVVPEVWKPVWQRDTDGQIVLADQSVHRVDENGDAIPGATEELPVRADPYDVWNLWEQTSMTTATPLRVIREHDRWEVDNAGCAISELDMTPDVDL